MSLMHGEPAAAAVCASSSSASTLALPSASSPSPHAATPERFHLYSVERKVRPSRSRLTRVHANTPYGHTNAHYAHAPVHCRVTVLRGTL